MADDLRDHVSDPIAVEGDHVAIQLVEPLELVTAARELAREHGFSLRAFAAASLATELLREDCEPTRSAWQWVRDSLQLDLPDDVGTFVAGEHAGYVDLGGQFDDFLARPVLVLDSAGSRVVVDDDEIAPASDFVFERHGDAWFVKSRPRGRSRFSTRRGQDAPLQLHVDGYCVESPHRLATGDRVSVEISGRHYSECDVTAII